MAKVNLKYLAKPKFVVLEHSMSAAGRDMFERREAHVVLNPDDQIKVLAKITRSIDDDTVVFKIINVGDEEDVRQETSQLAERSSEQFGKDWREFWNPTLPHEGKLTPTMSLVAALEPDGPGVEGGADKVTAALPAAKSRTAESMHGRRSKTKTSGRETLDKKSGRSAISVTAAKKSSHRGDKKSRAATSAKSVEPVAGASASPAAAVATGADVGAVDVYASKVSIKGSSKRGSSIKSLKRVSVIPSKKSSKTQRKVAGVGGRTDDEVGEAVADPVLSSDEGDEDEDKERIDTGDTGVLKISGSKVMGVRGGGSNKILKSKRSYNIKLADTGRYGKAGGEYGSDDYTDGEYDDDYDYDSDTLKDPDDEDHGSENLLSETSDTSDTSDTSSLSSTTEPEHYR